MTNVWIETQKQLKHTKQIKHQGRVVQSLIKLAQGYGAFLVSKFKTSFQTCYFSIQIFNPVIKTWNSSIQTWYPSIPISNS